MNAIEDHVDGDSLTEAITKYAELATHAETCMAQMEANFEDKFSMMTMQQPPQKQYYPQPPPPQASYFTPRKLPPTHPPRHNQCPSTITVPTSSKK